GTGAMPGAHGVLGFHVRIPGSDRVLNHTRWADVPDPAAWQPVPTLFARAVTAGVAATVVADGAFAGSGLSASAYRGADYRAGDEVDELVAGVRATLATRDGPALVYVYHPDLDVTGHVYGIASPEWREAAADVDRLVTMLATGLPPDTALLVTADHGQLDVPPDHRFDIDRDPRLREGVEVVAGEPRVRYLHVRRGAADDVADAWRGILGDTAWVATRQEVVDLGLFGPIPPDHVERVGDLVVVCRRDFAVTSYGHARREAELVGYHGAMTAAEMEIPLIVIRGG
ncbi:MAG TPA: alkaline phosphatase family protein, partial [Micromonosporaceae bacterium]|nr:alkaline phosphatase family protein [Micromonosporaceae bacterium]